jgi:hypothetical protein
VGLGRPLAWQGSVQLLTSLAEAWLDLWKGGLLVVLRPIRVVRLDKSMALVR